MVGFRVFALIVMSAFLVAGPLSAEDWPMWRYDAGHTGASPETLPANLSLQWVRDLPPIQRAWPDQDRLEFDTAYEPIAAGSLLYIGSPMNDAVLAFDAATGEEKWRFYTGGPVRLAPAVSNGLLYAGSDDGFLYCLDAATGALKWRFQAALSDRMLLGNTRMMSVWPVRGAPVIADGRIYFAAGIWPFEGVSIYCLNAETGEVVWMNDNCNARYMLQPHNSPAFSGLAPQGYLAVAGSRLLVPNGRATAACLDRETGALQYFEHAASQKSGDYRVAVKGEYYFNPTSAYLLDKGQNLGMFPSPVAVTDNMVVGVDILKLRAFDFTGMKTSSAKNEKGKVEWDWEAPELWALPCKPNNLILAGPRMFACMPGKVFSIDVAQDFDVLDTAWQAPVEGDPLRLIAANGRLFVTTREGRLYCFGENAAELKTYAIDPTRTIEGEPAALAAKVLAATGVTDGYAYVLGDDNGAFSGTLAAQSNLKVAAVTASADAAARRALDDAGLYGHRVALIEGKPEQPPLPPYFASIAVVVMPSKEFASDAKQIAELYEHLRPYGGVACIVSDAAVTLRKTVSTAALPNVRVEFKEDLTLLYRDGALPDSADWTHQYADPSNTVVSRDARVKAPLGLLWFGGPTNTDILPRHGHGPSEHVVGGRLFIEGPDMIRAVDVYTGRVLWQVSLPDLGEAFNNTSHQPGANALGSNYVSLPDGIYIAYGEKCLRLNPETGEKIREFTLPIPQSADGPPDFGYIGVYGDMLVAGSGPMKYDEELKGETWNAVASKRLVGLNRHSGEPMWTCEAQASFRHNAIALGGGKVFCIDRATDELSEKLARRGLQMPKTGRILALNIRTGEEVWRTEENIFGTWLGYSADNDMLLQAGRPSRDMLPDEGHGRMITYRGENGSVLWDRELSYTGPCLLHGTTIIAQEKFFDLLTGDAIKRRNPLTGAELEMNWQRNYGCNTAIASENLVTFRSAAAGFFDLRSDGGTGNLGGFKSGCTSNLIAADGVLNAPDYTRTCMCGYQNQTSLALVYTPDVEMWTFNSFTAGKDRIKRVGLNFGAPGDRRDDAGTLWLDYPSIGGDSPEVAVVTEPETVNYYRYHSQRLTGDGLKWVAASGVTGLRKLTVKVEEGAQAATPYTVRLYFAEPDKTAKRIFAVSLQGKKVVKALNIAKDAGGPMRPLVKEFKAVQIQDALTIEFTPQANSETLLCGLELIAEE